MLDSVTPTDPQPAPVGHGQDVTDMVLYDLQVRREAGTKKYGVSLRTHNGRNALIDAYQEALDLVMYLRQQIAEQQSAKQDSPVVKPGELRPEEPRPGLRFMRYYRPDDPYEAAYRVVDTMQYGQAGWVVLQREQPECLMVPWHSLKSDFVGIANP